MYKKKSSYRNCIHNQRSPFIIFSILQLLRITADHGKAEEMFDPQANQARTSHTANQVPFIVITQSPIRQPLPLHGLKDIKQFILKNLGITPQ